MTGWEVQALKEAEDARIWEELNAPDPYEKQLRDAALDLSLAMEPISKAEDYLMDAVADVSETPMEARSLRCWKRWKTWNATLRCCRKNTERGSGNNEGFVGGFDPGSGCAGNPEPDVQVRAGTGRSDPDSKPKHRMALRGKIKTPPAVGTGGR